MTAKEFISTLNMIGLESEGAIPKREIFSLAKEFQQLAVPEVVKLLQDEDDDYRLGAVSILDWKARDKKTSIHEREATYRAYMDNHHWINDWGMVDRAAPYVVGGWLYDKSRGPLYELAKSNLPMERRTAIVSTYYFIRKDDTADTFKIARSLVNDSDEYVQKAVGSWVREAGKRDEAALKDFLNDFAATMPRVTLRYAIEKLDRAKKDYYLAMKGNR